MSFIVTELKLNQNKSIDAGDGKKFVLACAESSTYALYPSLRIKVSDQSLLLRNFLVYTLSPTVSVLQSSEAPNRMLFFSSLGAYSMDSDGNAEFNVPMALPNDNYLVEWGNPSVVYLQDFAAIVAPLAVCIVDKKLNLVAMFTKFVDDNVSKTEKNAMYFEDSNEGSWSFDAGVSYLSQRK